MKEKERQRDLFRSSSWWLLVAFVRAALVLLWLRFSKQQVAAIAVVMLGLPLLLLQQPVVVDIAMCIRIA